MGQITLRGIRKSFSGVDVIHGIDLTIADGELAVFVGPSGCGKSTLLRMIAGLDRPTTGTIEIDGQDVTRTSAAERGLAMVFQSYALYPHMTVRQNLSFGLENTRMPKNDITARVDDAGRMLEIMDLMDRRPTQLSGGQRQRVAIGRAIVRNPTAFLLDEPLSNLDAELRGSMRAELAGLHDRLKTTMIYVTHDQIEAMTLADKIVVLRKGVIEQVDTPLGLYNRPQNLFVAGFIGAPNMNFFNAVAVDGQAELPGGLRVAVPGNGPVTIGIRPQMLHLADPDAPALTGTIRLIEALGAETVVHAAAADGTAMVVVLSGQPALRTGETIRLAFDPDALHVFGADGQRLD
ncbi:carbohydrate ABC transporter ATP-binding protein, CUT1 family [Loktanella fryxellensis]|uniref:Carbohydrate ABC transporter ATP-binding protein, CUT1 family n=1 Tax=Loktanella fryxellensis TaxID=245187 RepID=A0A1H8HRP7_9RHOB|nr:sn-glycerol-3-phosphate ABC transporter ATP-binding protein UgpC [Loktanella fryxellensis]SEN58754.1 carbohydrate ABC transporter ATP-binding protein, CUT1 family [Loktanella fryxellensis]